MPKGAATHRADFLTYRNRGLEARWLSDAEWFVNSCAKHEDLDDYLFIQVTASISNHHPKR